MAFEWLANPNAQRTMASIGAAIGGNTTGGAISQAAGQYIGNKAMQNALGQGSGQASATGQASQSVGQGAVQTPTYGQYGGSISENPANYDFLTGEVNAAPTPAGQPGPDKVTTVRTAKGVKQTIETPTIASAISPYATTPSYESISNQSSGASSQQASQGQQLPFWQALLGQY